MKIIMFVVMLLTVIIIFLSIPQSPLKNKYVQEVKTELNQSNFTDEVFTYDDIKHLPSPMQRYFEYCGFIGKTKMMNCKFSYDDVDFKMAPDKPSMQINYQQYNFVMEPARVAYIGASMSGIPFEGRDKYEDGKGAMIGVFAKVFTLFDVQGKEMDQSGLVTYLAECFLIPNMALQNYITWEAIDDRHAKATIEWKGKKASGIFTFTDNGEMKTFETDDRYMDKGKGVFEKVRWTCEAGEYIETNGIKHPSVLKAFWNLPEGEYLYFDSRGLTVEYNVK